MVSPRYPAVFTPTDGYSFPFCPVRCCSPLRDTQARPAELTGDHNPSRIGDCQLDRGREWRSDAGSVPPGDGPRAGLLTLDGACVLQTAEECEHMAIGAVEFVSEVTDGDDRLWVDEQRGLHLIERDIAHDRPMESDKKSIPPWFARCLFIVPLLFSRDSHVGMQK